MKKDKRICAWCYYARMRKDICGIYCTGGFENPDGTCDYFLDSHTPPKKRPPCQWKEEAQDGGH